MSFVVVMGGLPLLVCCCACVCVLERVRVRAHVHTHNAQDPARHTNKKEYHITYGTPTQALSPSPSLSARMQMEAERARIAAEKLSEQGPVAKARALVRRSTGL